MQLQAHFVKILLLSYRVYKITLVSVILHDYTSWLVKLFNLKLFELLFLKGKIQTNDLQITFEVKNRNFGDN